MNIPRDPYILLSYVNMKLRDQYGSLAALCEDLDADEKEIRDILFSAGFLYDPDTNQFR